MSIEMPKFSMTTQFFIRSRGKIRGPFELKKIAEMQKRGLVSRVDELSLDKGTWAPAFEVLGIEPEQSFLSSSGSVDKLETIPPTTASNDGPQPWYASAGGEQVGPFSLMRLRAMLHSGELTESDLVWKQGMPSWLPVSRVSELAAATSKSEAGATTPGKRQVPVTCSACGAAVDARSEHCLKCGSRIPGMVMSSDLPANRGLTDASGRRHMYAGFWPRFGARIVDNVILIGPILGLTYGLVLPVGAIIGGAVLEATGRNSDAFAFYVMFWAICFPVSTFVLEWLYYACMESSRFQGTIGKRSVGIRVVDINGGRITFLRATGRYAAKWLSGLILMIGFLMAGFTERRQALHDFVADTFVVMD
jgi:uncharacterized RDD family membrane protein YckC